MTNSRNLTDAEGIALLERTGATWQIAHYKGDREPFISANLTFYDTTDHGHIHATGYDRTVGRAALRCLIDAMRQLEAAAKKEEVHAEQSKP